MNSAIMAVGEGLQSIIYSVATVLLYPVLAAEVVALVWVAFEAGRFTLEIIRRARARRIFDVDGIAAAAGAAEGTDVVAHLGTMPSPAAVRATTSLGDGQDLSRTRVLKALADAELEASRRLERTRVLVRVGPTLGLMGTLIPISPALVALARGDVETLSSNLVIAFSTTVVGLLIGTVAYLISTVRDRHYRQDVVELEYVLDRIGGVS